MWNSFATTVSTPRNAGPHRALPALRPSAGHDPDLRPGRIHRLHRRHEERVHPARLGQRPVAIEVARVAAEVFVGPELQRIDEDAHHDHVGPAPGLIHQREVTLVQGAHGRHEADALPCRTLAGDQARRAGMSVNSGA